MALEIERKFLVNKPLLPPLDDGETIVQGYILTQSKTAVRIRIKGSEAYLTIKGENTGAIRAEYEYPIPLADAEEMLENLCDGPKISKTRYRVEVSPHIWEIDEFHSENAGLILAEIELSDESESFHRPEWLAGEVTHDPRYYNSNLAVCPYSSWG